MKKLLFLLLLPQIILSQVDTLSLDLTENDTLKLTSVTLESELPCYWIYTDLNTTINDFTGDTIFVSELDSLFIEGFSFTNYQDLDRTIRLQYLDVNDLTGSFESLIWTTPQISITDFYNWSGEYTDLTPNNNNTVYQLFVEIVRTGNTSSVLTHIYRFFIKLESNLSLKELQLNDCKYSYYDVLGREIDSLKLKSYKKYLRVCNNKVEFFINIKN